MEIVRVHAKSELEPFLRREPLLHLYELGDLDDYFWPRTTWYALVESGAIRQLVLIYTDLSIPIVLANTAPPVDSMRDLLRALLPILPKRFYGHLNVAVADVFRGGYCITPHGDHYRMGLTDRSRPAAVETSRVEHLTVGNLDEVQSLYRASSPANWFVPRMLETGCYYGVRDRGALVSVAGVHICSKRYDVAALGNIATHPDYRSSGFATAVAAKLCQGLLRDGIEHIGLNVKVDNGAAIACYEKIGFTRAFVYGEYTLESKA